MTHFRENLMGMKAPSDAAALAMMAGLLAATGVPRSLSRGCGRQLCYVCVNPILAGEGYRHEAGKGYVHGKCAAPK